MSARRGILSALHAVMLAASLTIATEAHGESHEELDAARALVAEGRAGEAIELLKRAVSEEPGNEARSIALAEAYLADDNQFWALRVLGRFAREHPPACASRALAARVVITMAQMDRARDLLAEAESACGEAPADRARWALLRALIAHHQGDAARVRTELSRARESGSSYAEDQALLRTLEQAHDPGRMPVHSASLDVGVGYTTNALSGAPLDTVSLEGASPLLTVGARYRLVVPASAVLRPSVELSVRATEFFAPEVGDLSYRQPGLRVGFLLGEVAPRVFVGYAASAVHLEAGDRLSSGPAWFSETHRGEYELEISDRLLAFGGAGRHIASEMGRSRWEADLGLAYGLRAADTNFTFGASARRTFARRDAWSLQGATVLAEARRTLSRAVEARALLSLSHDAYPHSGGFFAEGAEERREWLGRGSLGVFHALTELARVGLEYQLSHRESSVGAYDYMDHRALARLELRYHSDHQRAVSGEGRPELVHPEALSAAGAGEHQRIRELMQHDDNVTQSSTCLR
jgi:hypothetical protein